MKIAVIVFGAILAGLIVWTIIKHEVIYTAISAAVPVIAWAACAVSSKELNPKNIPEWVVKKWAMRQCRKKGCSDIEKQLIEEKIDKLKNEIAKYEGSSMSA